MPCKRTQCGEPLTDDAGRRTGYCSPECYEIGAFDGSDDDEPRQQSPQVGDAIRVNEKPCASCPFVAPERRAIDFVPAADAEALREQCKTSGRDAPNVCHSSVYGMHGLKANTPSVCRGFIEANPTHPFVLDMKYKLPRPKTIPVKVPHPAKVA